VYPELDTDWFAVAVNVAHSPGFVHGALLVNDTDHAAVENDTPFDVATGSVGPFAPTYAM